MSSCGQLMYGRDLNLRINTLPDEYRCQEGPVKAAPRRGARHGGYDCLMAHYHWGLTMRKAGPEFWHQVPFALPHVRREPERGST